MTPRQGEAGAARGRAGTASAAASATRTPSSSSWPRLLLLPAVLGLQAFFTSGSWTQVPLEHWLVKQSDDYTYVAWTVTRHKADPARPPERLPAGWFLGPRGDHERGVPRRRGRQARWAAHRGLQPGLDEPELRPEHGDHRQPAGHADHRARRHQPGPLHPGQGRQPDAGRGQADHPGQLVPARLRDSARPASTTTRTRSCRASSRYLTTYAQDAREGAALARPARA